MEAYKHLIIVDKSADSFGTLTVRVFNTVNRQHYTVWLDEGDHHMLKHEIESLANMPVREYEEPIEGNGVFE